MKLQKDKTCPIIWDYPLVILRPKTRIMKCELIIEGLQDREQFWEYCWESDTCVNWHDDTIHAIYYSKQCAREEAKLLKSYYPDIKTHISTDFDGWLYISNRILKAIR